MANKSDVKNLRSGRDWKVQSLGEFGKLLAMRPQGKRVQESLDSLLRALPPGGVLVLDFDNVEMMDYSFADEALGTLYSRLAAKEYPDRYLVLVTDEDEITQALLENVEAALNRREVAALVVPRAAFEKNGKSSSGEWRIIGTLPKLCPRSLTVKKSPCAIWSKRWAWIPSPLATTASRACINCASCAAKPRLSPKADGSTRIPVFYRLRNNFAVNQT
jgi:hypothetical protein